MKKQDLVKSTLLGEKEASLKELTKKLQKVRKELQKQKSVITEFQDHFRNIQTEVSEKIMANTAKLVRMKQELMKVFAEVMKLKSIKKKEKRHLKDMIEFINQVLPIPHIPEPADNEEDEEPDFSRFYEEQEEAKSAHIFDDFMVKPKDKEQQDIRKVFIRLATRFHPDKAATTEEADEFHRIMQRINEAYSRGDFAELLEIEAFYKENDVTVIPKFDQESETLNYLEKEIEQKQRELELLEDQLKRTKLEIKQTKGSEMGKMVKHYNKEVKNGNFQENIDQLEKMQALLQVLKEILDEVKETGKVDDEKIGEKLNKAAKEAGVIMEEDEADLEAELLEMLFAEMESQKRRGGRGSGRRY